MGGGGKVLTFEPDSNNYEALTRNIAAHQLTNVTAFNMGIWSVTTTLSFQAEGNLGSSIAMPNGRTSNLHSISVISLDDLVEKCGLERLDFAKFDIEGAELSALAAASNAWWRLRPKMVIEPHVVNGTVCTEALCEILRYRGYAIQILPQAKLRLPLIYAEPKSIC